MRYRFTLQIALDRLVALEALERRRVAELRATLRLAEDRIAGIAAEIARRRTERMRGGATAPELAIFDAASVALAALGRRARGERDSIAADVEIAREAYAQAAARRMGLERLRERKRAAAALARERAEGAELDEANAARSARGRVRIGADENEQAMIELHRRGGSPIVVNADLIETVERDDAGETVVTLTTGNALAVRESPEAVGAAALAYRRAIAHPGP